VTLAHLAHETLLLARQRDNVLTIKVICVYDTADVDVDARPFTGAWGV